MPMLRGIARMAGVPTNAMTVYAYDASRFPLPPIDAPAPDGLPADAGPFTSANDLVAGVVGAFSGAVPTLGAYLLSAVGGDGHTYWLDAIVPQPDVTARRSTALTSLAVGGIFNQDRALASSAGDTTINATQTLTLGTATTITVAGTTAMGTMRLPSTVIIAVAPASGWYTAFTYTSLTSTTLTGTPVATTVAPDQGNAGMLSAGMKVYRGAVAGAVPRRVMACTTISTNAAFDGGDVEINAEAAGAILSLGGHQFVAGAAGFFESKTLLSFDVDAGGMYWLTAQAQNAGSIACAQWTERDYLAGV